MVNRTRSSLGREIKILERGTSTINNPIRVFRNGLQMSLGETLLGSNRFRQSFPTELFYFIVLTEPSRRYCLK